MAETVLLVGDSHLAKVDKPRAAHLETLVGTGTLVVNAAMGGTHSSDLLRQLPVLTTLAAPADGQARAVVVSVGCNDLAPWKRVPVAQFGDTLTATLERLGQESAVVALAPPPVVDDGDPGARSNRDVAQYAAAVAHCCRRTGATFVDTAAVLAAEGPSAKPDGMHLPDGVHLNDAAYAVLLPAVAAAVSAAATANRGVRRPRRP